MKLYHGSLEVVKHPIILQPNRKFGLWRRFLYDNFGGAG